MTYIQFKDFVDSAGVKYVENLLLSHYLKIAEKESIKYEYFFVKIKKHSYGFMVTVSYHGDIHVNQLYRTIVSYVKQPSIYVSCSDDQTEDFLKVEYRKWKINQI